MKFGGYWMWKFLFYLMKVFFIEEKSIYKCISFITAIFKKNIVFLKIAVIRKNE